MDDQGGNAVNWRIDVTEIELISWNLTIRRHVPLSEEEHQLILRKRGIDDGERNHVKSQVPGSELLKKKIRSHHLEFLIVPYGGERERLCWTPTMEDRRK